MKECLFEFGTSSTPGKVGIGNLLHSVLVGWFPPQGCEKTCESLCKQSQKMVKECLFEFGTGSTPGKVGIGNLSVLLVPGCL